MIQNFYVSRLAVFLITIISSTTRNRHGENVIDIWFNFNFVFFHCLLFTHFCFNYVLKSEHEGLVDSFGREIKPRDIYDERNRDSARESSREQEPAAVSSELRRPNRDPHDSALVVNRKSSGEYNQRIPKRRFEGNDISYSNGGGGGKLSRFDSSDNRDRGNLNNNREWGHPPAHKDNIRPSSRFSGGGSGGGRESRDGRFPSRTGPFGRGAGGRGREGGGNNYNRENRPTERGQLPPPAPPAPPLPPKDGPNTSLRIHQVIPPLVTFKTFMQHEIDDFTPEEFQKRYDEYNLQYVHDFCEAFFNVNIPLPLFMS